MKNQDILPRLLPIEAFPIEHEGNPLAMLRDPSGYAPGTISVSYEVLLVLEHCDGQTTFEQMAAHFREVFQQDPDATEIGELLSVMDQCYLLDNQRSADFRQAMDREFLDAKTRPFTCFNKADDPEQIRNLLDIGFTESGFAPGPEIETGGEKVSGIIAPHIDFFRGYKGYGAAYGPLLSGFEGDRVIILGTNHQFASWPVALTMKNFDTVFGMVETDAELVKSLSDKIDGDPFADQLAHRNEHSIELAATLISYAGRNRNWKILPILLAGFYPYIESGQHPESHAQVRTLIEGLRELIAREPERYAVIASADLAHVGLQFGDEFEFDQAKQDEVENKDRASLRFVESGDAEGFYNYIADEKDERHVCGLAPIYYLRRILNASQGTLRHYETWTAEDNAGAVSFCALTLSQGDVQK